MLLENKQVAIHLAKHIDEMITKKLNQLSRVIPKDAVTDAANTWWLRGQIASLEQFKKELLNEDNKE